MYIFLYIALTGCNFFPKSSEGGHKMIWKFSSRINPGVGGWWVCDSLFYFIGPTDSGSRENVSILEG